MTLDQIKALPVAQLAAKDCALFMWGTWPNMPMWRESSRLGGFAIQVLLSIGSSSTPMARVCIGVTATQREQNPEPCLLAKRGNPLRLDEGVHSVIMAPVGAHSEKPDEAYVRMKRLSGGPYLELFARKQRPGWHVWGNEAPYDANADFAGSIDDCYAAVRERIAGGGQGWTP